MNSDVIPFGKYKGKPVEVLASDKGYCDWLMSQGDFLDRYSNIKTLIINNFKEAEDTPEHNSLQGLFLDESICKALHAFVIGEDVYFEHFDKYTSALEYHGVDGAELTHGFCEIYDLAFESRGADVKFSVWSYILKGKQKTSSYDMESELFCLSPKSYAVELKPSVGDDYPTIMRQMKSNHCNVLVYSDYIGLGISEDQFRKMFALSSIKCARIDEVRSRLELN